MLKITRPSVFFPGGYVYVQKETGFRTGGNNLLKVNAMLLMKHRKGNALARATLDECIEDITLACCLRYPRLCNESGVTLSESFRTGASFTMPVFPNRVAKKCGSCGGRRAKK